MHILVVGAGSIGQRHIRNLVELGVDVTSVDPKAYGADWTQLDAALAVRLYDAAVVAVPTHLHMETVLRLHRGEIWWLLIEKPLAHSMEAANKILNVALPYKTVLGYSLRFHPALQIIRDLLPQIGTPLYARAEVGQYLPDWHPTGDYRNWYMAKEAQGGGALLDLSHELDYMRWLFGSVQYPSGFVGKLSNLEIDSDDLAEFQCLMGNETHASIHMNLLDRSYNRRLRILGSDATVDWNYADGFVRLLEPSKKETKFEYDTDRNIQFLEEMRAFISSVETGVVDERFATLEDGIEVLEVVDDLKRQNGRGQYGC